MVQQKTCIFILGMHRSGTSALTGMLNLLGVELGTDLMQPWADNPKGFFENNKIWQFNQKILESFGSSWDDPFLYGDDWCSHHALEPFEHYIIDLLDNEFADSPLFAIKDPRMCILFPLWKSVLDKQGVRSVCVLPFRHPMEVARSLTKRNGYSNEKGILLWTNYTLTAERVSRGCRRLFLEFADLFSGGEQIVDKMMKNMQLSFPLTCAEAGDRINDFLDRDLKHHAATAMASTVVESRVQKIYEHYCRAVDLNASSTWEEELDQLALEYIQMASFFLNSDLQEVAGCPRELKTAERSIATLEMDCTELKGKLSQAEGNLSALQVKKQAQEDEMNRMRDTKAWRLAELVRRLKARL
ncbi:MAG: hypothetical protein BA863_04990 [Desulfovibrio sp. S3730MH75]|nr:MAG: hypothetical protein BA863_04990 [Desulfovibrio sp. S3730MH75]